MIKSLDTLALYFNTLRHLKPVQFWYRIRSKVIISRINDSPAPKLRSRQNVWVQAPCRQAALKSQSRFKVLNEEKDISSKDIWNNKSLDKLWLYHLHYFDDVSISTGSEEMRVCQDRFISRWIHENPAGTGIGWEPYPLSRRIVNLIKRVLAGRDLEPSGILSLAIQIRFLSQRLEKHLLGNHLMANAKALIFAGLFFEGKEADRWFRAGVRLLRDEIPEQILSDGGHFERSPMYHSIILEDFLDLYNLTRVYQKRQDDPELAGQEWDVLIRKMRYWLKVMCHPDGQISLFNDAAFNAAIPPADLERYAERLGFLPMESPANGVIHLEESGYIRVQNKNAVAILDVAPLGPDYLPGHGHADTLTFELSVHNHRLIVNTGTSCYGEKKQRFRERSTAAHNTCEVDGENSSEVWSSFRVARRAKPFGLLIEKHPGTVKIKCSHDGYQRLPGRVCHTRLWEISEGGMRIQDTVTGKRKGFKSRLLFSPETQIENDGNLFKAFIKSSDSVQIKIRTDIEDIALEEAKYHPEFGVFLKSKRLVMTVQEGNYAGLFMEW